MEAANERDLPVRDSDGVPGGRRCTCGVDMMKRTVDPRRSERVVHWTCSCCGRDERIAYGPHGSADWVDA